MVSRFYSKAKSGEGKKASALIKERMETRGRKRGGDKVRN